MSERRVLPLTPTGEEPRLRADAVRNRARLLAAAARLAEEYGVEHLTMDAVANAADVGKGTVFRRFGDRVGLLQALLDHVEVRFQTGFLEGDPPLGPGAPPKERLVAFGIAALRHDYAHIELYLAAEGKPERRHLTPSLRVRHTHLVMLLRAAGTSGDAELLGQALLAYLDTSLVRHLVVQREMPLERLEAGWIDLVDRVAT
ncbi:TetR/AcrR family transcriptional regulator [Saccharomonospora sp. CUA-673]|uniref:TetR/AcrR family transcriptional regulator n=1 Tax=Saccharomonospora sp. CUA-673 TaxID=1904969 RepID=UPI00210114ED|nr:TetR/AcrR family transcriptional regulator [Saccharomonospora sp. CUA-673]